ncbi:hypothetical protein [Bradyrhizobium sp. CCBAU 25338]|uniref:hypothetical protein n=1 Tax=Bradyrhizobium sp. CCBAU 25338 TaxID=1641877 RepID=UPI0023045E20|nr:hypothetical protein [Bradyrhizobium sp. CCBAU 25338]MDA9530336.1 hypothetical protein [Bradyrhizobium sp. CCBAU 25338]
MSHKLNLVRVLTAATGPGTNITLGAAYSQSFMTPAESGAIDGRTYTYLISEGNNWELGRGAYTAAGTVLARTTVLASRSGGTLGTSRISLTGSAQVRFTELAEDMDGLRGTRSVTGTSDVITNADLGYAITYSNASAIAATIAQAGASSQFLDGWACWVKNTGAGALTITPAASTINGGSSLVLAQNLGAMIWSDGSNYHAFVMPITKPLLAANDLSEVNAVTARKNLGIPATMRGYLDGLTLSTAGSSSTFSVAPGVAVDDTNTDFMTLAAAISKTTSAWAVGNNNGALDASTIANNTWYHVFEIKRPDTGVVDILISTSASSPTMPTNYTLKRRIGAMKTNGSGQWTKFIQRGDEFLWDAMVNDTNAANPGTGSGSLYTLSVPSGVQVSATLAILWFNVSASVYLAVVSPDTGTSVGANAQNSMLYSANSSSPGSTGATVRTNTSGQVRAIASGASGSMYINTLGWIDRRGRDG